MNKTIHPSVAQFRFETYNKKNNKTLWKGTYYKTLAHKKFKDIPNYTLTQLPNGDQVVVPSLQAYTARAFYELQHFFHTTAWTKDTSKVYQESPYGIRMHWSLRVQGEHINVDIDYSTLKDTQFKEWYVEPFELDQQNVDNYARYKQAREKKPSLRINPRGSDLLINVLKRGGIPVMTMAEYDRLTMKVMDMVQPFSQKPDFGDALQDEEVSDGTSA